MPGLDFYFDRPLSKLPIQNTYEVSTEYVTKGQVQIFGFLSVSLIHLIC